MKKIKDCVLATLCVLAASVPGYAQFPTSGTAPRMADASPALPNGTAMPHGELVQNGNFEATSVNDPKTGSRETLHGWSLVREGDAQGEIASDDAAPPSPAGPHALRLTATRLGRRCGAANSGFGGMTVQAGSWYDVSFFCRTENKRHTGLVFSLESRDGRTICARATIPEVGGDWQPYTLSLHAYAADRHARLVISPIDPGVLWLDGVSLVPRTAH